MSDFKMNNATKDLDITGGLQIVNGVNEVPQRLRLALSINLGEWFVNVFEGLPYLDTQDPNLPSNTRYFLGDRDPAQERYIQKTLDNYIRNQSYISSVTSDVSFDRSQRQFEYNYTATTTGGDTISDTFSSSI